MSQEDGRTGGSARREFWGSRRTIASGACAVSLRLRTTRTRKKLADLPSSHPPCESRRSPPRAIRTIVARGVPLSRTERRGQQKERLLRDLPAGVAARRVSAVPLPELAVD